MPGVEHPRTGPVETPAQERERLLNETVRSLAQQGMQEWQRYPTEKRDEGVRRMYERMLGKLQTLHAASPALTARARTELDPLLSTFETPDAENRLETIYDAIEAELPSYGEEPIEHPYLSRSEIAPLTKRGDGHTNPEDMLSRYHIDNGSLIGAGQIRGDIAFLRTILQPLPANSAASKAVYDLIVHLEQMRLCDPKNAIAETMRQQKGGDTTMDIAGKEMGRIALTGFLLAGTVIFGTIGLVQFIRSKGKEISLAPFLWGIATWLMADKELLRSFFGQDATIMKQFDQINVATTSPVLTDVTTTYGIGGMEWSKVVERFYEDDFEKALKTGTPDDETVADTINTLSGEPAMKPGETPPRGTIRGTLKAMFDAKDPTGRNDFQRFAERLLAVEGNDAREFMVTYVRNNAFRVGVDLDPKTGRGLKAAAAAKPAAR